jgi:hypothetical protein
LPWFFIGYWILHEAGFLSGLFVFLRSSTQAAKMIYEWRRVAITVKKRAVLPLSRIDRNLSFAPEVD